MSYIDECFAAQDAGIDEMVERERERQQDSWERIREDAYDRMRQMEKEIEDGEMDEMDLDEYVLEGAMVSQHDSGDAKWDLPTVHDHDECFATYEALVANWSKTRLHYSPDDVAVLSRGWVMS